jgi:DNA-binding PadR family transcriptional regulator
MAAAMREPTFYILTALARAPMYGYGLIAEVAELSNGAVELRPGTLYGALDRLVEENLVAADGEEIVDGRARRYYRLTEFGAEALQAEIERLRRNVEAAATRLADRTSTSTAARTPTASATAARTTAARPAVRVARAARAAGGTA